jgi:galactarate dehydratase
MTKAGEAGHKTIQINQRDNVAIVVDPGGLKCGALLDNGIRLISDVPQGHKAALVHLAAGEPIIRYGEVIGYATADIARGQWVHEGLVRLPEPPRLSDIPLSPCPAQALEPLDGYSFEGYRNPDGSVGIRNILGISTSVQCVAGVANVVLGQIKQKLLPKYPNVDDVVVLNHSYGCGVAIKAPAAIIPIRTLQNLARNPNLGNEVMVLGLGCEKLEPCRLVSGTPEDVVLELQDKTLQGFSGMVEGILELAERKLARLNQRRRETCPASDLVVGLQCGGSDAFSGVTANPAVGFAADLIVRTGGTVLFSEVTEVRDGIQLLVPRAVDTDIGRALLREMAWYDRYLELGEVDRSANTAPGNKQGGLANIVEKALGSIVKSGTSPIVDVLAPGERVRKKGLVFAATPASDFVCGTLQLAAGINLQVFTTGRGTPYGLALAPVIKVSSRSDLSRRWHDLIDLDAGRIATGEAGIADVGWDLFHLILDVASGRKETAAGRLGLYNDLVLFDPAPVT